MLEWITLIVIPILIIIIFIIIYRNFVKLNKQVKDSWSQIDNQLRKRSDLILKLVDTIKSYDICEQQAIEDVLNNRNKLINAYFVQDCYNANHQLSTSLKSLFTVAETYSELNSSSNYHTIKNQLADSENEISNARLFYNDSVYNYNNACHHFPTNLLANLLNFNEKDFFKSNSCSIDIFDD